jgi:hypothetical protein
VLVVSRSEATDTVPCRDGCTFGHRHRRHHDRLLAVEGDTDAVLDLFELAVTWGELDYSTVGVIPPSEWAMFAAQHRWQDPARCERLFALATDAALHSQACAATPP